MSTQIGKGRTQSGNIADRLRAHADANRAGKGPKCLACLLPRDVMDAVRSERARNTSMAVIAAFLRKEGYPITISPLGRHLRGQCSAAQNA